MLQNWLSSCLVQILLTSEGRDHIDFVETSSLLTYHDVFRAVLAAYGGSPPDDVVDAVIDCASRRRRTEVTRRRRDWQSVRGCSRCRRRPAPRPWRQPRTSPGDGRVPHLQGVHPQDDTRLRRHRSIPDDDSHDPCRKYVTNLLLKRRRRRVPT